jgi:hypothetical protein
MSEPRCKMSIYIEEYDETANYCALATLVKCEGKHDDSKNCPYWKRGDGEP